MATTENVTTKFKVDISDLKKNIAEANRQIKAYNAEIKNASAGMQKGEETVDSLSAKIEAQSKVVSAEEAKLEALKQQLERYNAKVTEGESTIADLTRKHDEAAQAYGENSDEVKALAKQLEQAQAAQERNKIAVQNLNTQIINQDTAVKNAQAQVRTYQSALNTMQNEITDSASYMETLTERVRAQKSELQELKSRYVDVVTSQGNTSDEARQLATQIQNLSNELRENQTELNQAEKEADELDKSLEDVGDEADSTTNGGLSAFGVALGNLAANLIASAISKLKELVVQTVKVGVAFDESMSKVKAISGATEEDFEKLREKAGEMGSTTKFTATEAAEAMNYMAMAGWKTEDMLDGIDGIMNLAAASGEDLATTSDIVTDALTAMGYTADDSARFADVLAAASSNANTNVSLMGESFKYVAPITGSMGASMEDLSIALGLMANSGIKGSKAGNSLKNALVNLVKPTEQQTAAMEKLGLITTVTTKSIDSEKLEKAQTKVANKTIDLEKAQIAYNMATEKYSNDAPQVQLALSNVEKAQNNLAEAQRELNKEQKGTIETVSTGQSAFTDASGNMKSLREIIDILRSSLSAVNVELTDGDGNLKEYDDLISDLSQTEDGLTQAEQLKNAAILFGKQNLSGMLAIVNASEEDYNKLTDAIDNCSGTAEDMATIMLDNLGGDMTLFKSQLESVQRTLYDKFEPTLRKGVAALGKLLDNVVLIVDHSAEFSAALAAIGVAVGAYVAWQASVKLMALGWAGVTAAIEKTTIAQIALNIAEKANPIGILITLLAALVAAFVVLWTKCDWFREFWINVWNKIKEVAGTAWEAITGFFTGAWEKIQDVWSVVSDFFSGVWDGIKKVFAPVIHFFETIFSGAWETIKWSWDFAVTFFKNIWILIKAIFTPIVEWFGDKFGKAWAAVKKVWDIVSSYYKSIWNNIKNTFSHAGDYFKEKFSDAWNKVKAVFAPAASFFGGIWDKIKKSFSSIGTKVGEAIGNAFKIAINAVIATVESSINAIPNALNEVIDKINELPGVNLSPMPTVSLPRLAKGGIVNRSTLANVGEDGAEAIIPLEKNKAGLKQIAKLIAQEINSHDYGQTKGRPQTNNNITYNFNQTNNSPTALSRYDIYRQSKNLLGLFKAVKT